MRKNSQRLGRSSEQVPLVASPVVALPKPRWRTPEFLLYYVAIVLVLWRVLVDSIGLSAERGPVNMHIHHRLTVGWMPGWMIARTGSEAGPTMVDNSDFQYGGFRNRIPLLFAVMLGYLVLSWLVRFIAGGGKSKVVAHQEVATSPVTTTERSVSAAPLWSAFLLVFSLVFLSILHGIGVVKIVVLLSINYVLTKILGRMRAPMMPLAVWTFCVAVLFLNDIYRGYSFGILSGALSFLDKWGGLMPRWYINFNITMLRMISFSMDYYWSMSSSHPTSAEKQKQKLDVNGDDFGEKYRTENSHAPSAYSYFHYLTYCLYTPLYLAGPIITFNNFYSQIIRPHKLNLRTTAIYGVRLAAVVLLMEWMMHNMFYVAMSKESSVWPLLSPYELAMFSYFNLKYIWLKLLIIWRFFRFWAMADGIETLENMTRCMSNNYSPIGFWRSWHRSYNRWLIRYIYVPLGGRDNRIYNTILIFTFVAVWHDLQLRLLVWGWLISLFIIPEALVPLFARKQLGHFSWYRHLAAFGGSVNIITMIFSNLIGFSVGIEGARHIIPKLLSPEQPLFLLGIFGCAFVATQIMFEIREEETRQRVKDGGAKRNEE